MKTFRFLAVFTMSAIVALCASSCHGETTRADFWKSFLDLDRVVADFLHTPIFQPAAPQSGPVVFTAVVAPRPEPSGPDSDPPTLPPAKQSPREEDNRKVMLLDAAKQDQTVQGEAGRVLWLALNVGDGTAIHWQPEPGGDRADFWHEPDGKVAMFNAPDAGAYKLRFYTLKDGKGSKIREVTILLKERIPPVPPPPKPEEDPLFAKILAAYKANADVTKSADRLALAAAYRSVGGAVSAVKTWGDLFLVMKTATDRGVGERLRNVRDVTGDALRDVTGKVSDTDAMTNENRAAVKKELDRWAGILEQLPN